MVRIGHVARRERERAHILAGGWRRGAGALVVVSNRIRVKDPRQRPHENGLFILGHARRRGPDDF